MRQGFRAPIKGYADQWDAVVMHIPAPVDAGHAKHFPLSLPRSMEVVGFARDEGPCVSRAGRHRLDHDFDSDGVCFWCDRRA